MTPEILTPEPEVEDSSPSEPVWRVKDVAGSLFARYGTIFLMITIVVFFTLRSPVFMTTATLENVLVQASISAISASGLTLVVAAGNWDLSFGSVAGLAGMVAAWVMGLTVGATGQEGNLLLALVVGLSVGLVCGALNGALIAYLGFNDLLTTLATSAVFLGLTWLPSEGYKIYKGLGDSYRFLYNGDIFGISVAIALMFAFVGSSYLLLHRSSAGRRIRATGGNALAAKYSGVRTPRTRFLVFTVAGGLAAIAGILTTSQQVGAWVLMGQPFLQRDFAAVFVGWAIVGKPSIIGTLIGVIFLGSVRVGLILIDIPFHYSDVITGLILLVAIAIGSERRRRS